MSVLLLVGSAEWLHGRRTSKVKWLAYGPTGTPAPWARSAAWIRSLSGAAIAWALVVLMFLTPRVHDADMVKPEDYRHVILVLDVSPSMRLQDGGPDRDQSRMQRASDVMESFFKRVAIQQYKMSVVAVYSSAKPVVVETNDVDVVRNILNDLPMHYAFPVGKTDLFSGLEEAAKLAKGWQPRSATVIVISDGDTVPATGMPKMPASVSNVVVVGIGDPVTGQFIDGRQSRQDTATLRQIAVRLGASITMETSIISVVIC
jgi:Ca-activated chloride channel family protein